MNKYCIKAYKMTQVYDFSKINSVFSKYWFHLECLKHV